MKPEDALAAARERAAAKADVRIPSGGLVVRRSAQPNDEELLQWAVVEPDLDEVRSTRRLGAPVTRTKQLLLRLLGQYHAQVLSVQNRVNVHLALRSSLARDEVRALREEVDALRRRLRATEDALGIARAQADEVADADAIRRRADERAEEEAQAGLGPGGGALDPLDGRTADQQERGNAR